MKGPSKGERSEIVALSKLSLMGFTVSQPFSYNSRYDFVLDTGDTLSRVQVKSANHKGGSMEIETRSTRPRADGCSRDTYDSSEIDAFVVYCREGDQLYYLPIEEVEGMSSVSLRIEPTENNQEKRIRWAEDYKVEEVLS